MTSYLFMPLMAIIVGFIAGIVARKNKILSKRKMIFSVLLLSVALCLPALLGFIRYVFTPYIYIALSLAYLALGCFGRTFVSHILSQTKKKDSFLTAFAFQALVCFIGAALFSCVFNLCSELKFGLWASTCLLSFLLPPLFMETFRRYMSIPPEIYKAWKYGDSGGMSEFIVSDSNRLLVMEIELYRTLTDLQPARFKVKAPDNMPFGLWFRYFISDCNLKRPHEPIEFDSIEEPYGWIFYVKPSFFIPRKYIDCDLSIQENGLREKHVITAIRVSEKNSSEIKQKTE
jgi:hypothetical protein